jgi:pimeloyl-ACP methyl ester carboxylesterase
VIPAPTPAEHGTATSSDGTRIAWWRYGDGERTVLFVPTWNLVDSRVVGHQIAALQDRATVIRFDPRGAGESDRPARGYDFPQHMDDALTVLDAVGVGTVDVVTASRGLNATVMLAVHHPDRVQRIAVIAPYMQLELDLEPPDPDAVDGLRRDWRGFIEPFMHSVFTEPGSDALIEEMIAIGLEASADVVADGELELDWAGPARLLGSVYQPTLIVHGEQDKPVPVDVARAIHAALPNARLELIPDGGHRPDIRSPELVNPLLLEFLAL